MHRLRASCYGRRRAGTTSRRDSRQSVLRDAGRAAASADTSGTTELDHQGHLGAVPQYKPNVLVTTAAVPRHRDQRAVHRLPLGQTARVRRPVAAGSVGTRLAWGEDDRVLALA